MEGGVENKTVGVRMRTSTCIQRTLHRAEPVIETTNDAL